MTIEFSTPYMGVCDMLLSVAVILYVTQGLAMHNIIKKHKLEKELDRFANLFYMETAIILTLISFLDNISNYLRHHGPFCQILY